MMSFNRKKQLREWSVAANCSTTIIIPLQRQLDIPLLIKE